MGVMSRYEEGKKGMTDLAMAARKYQGAEPPDSDPRPDLTADSERWTALLRAAIDAYGHGPLLGTLRGVRSMGATIVGRRIVQPADMDPTEWARDREEY